MATNVDLAHRFARTRAARAFVSHTLRKKFHGAYVLRRMRARNYALVTFA